MPRVEQLLWHRLSRRRLLILQGLASMSAAGLALVFYCVGAQRADLALLVAPTGSVLFALLVATLAVYAEGRLVSWAVVCAVLAGGPVAALLLLRLLAPSSGSGAR